MPIRTPQAMGGDGGGHGLTVLPPTTGELIEALSERLPDLVVVDHTAGGQWPRRPSPILQVGRPPRFRIRRRPPLPAHVEGLARQDGRVHEIRLHLPMDVPSAGGAPDWFRPLAVLAVRNEEDILGWVLDQMMDVEDLDVYVIDNHSTDGTVGVVREREGHPRLAGWELWPDEPDADLDWQGLLARKVEVVNDRRPSWAIHSDADEVRRSPWPGVSMRDAIWAVDQAGATQIDFTIVNHLPVRGHTPPDRTDVDRLDHVEFGLRPGYFAQTKAWKVPAEASIGLGVGGHKMEHPNPVPFPLNFTVDHYVVRSQAQGMQKVLVERRARWARERELRGWHVHYDYVDDAHDFEREPGSLPVDGPAWRRAAAGRLICRAGMVPDPTFRLV